MGMVITPVPATLAAAEPEIMPIRPEAITAALAGPELSLDLAPNLMPMSIRTWPPPQVPNSEPKIMIQYMNPEPAPVAVP